MARAASGRSRQTPVDALPADFGIERLAATAAALQAQVAERTAIQLQAAAVQRIHAASLQWLLALSLAARARGQTFSLHQPSPVLREAARRLGLAPDLMISPEEDSV
jgi:anti-anti-sigma regulatory factor